ncbi:MAG: lysylphosphatidylglycerol synthase domain-containing protein [Caldimonas sp.]
MKRILAVVFFAGVLGLVAHYARSVDWPAVWEAMRTAPASTLLAAAGLTAASYAVYCCYDLIGRHETGHSLPTADVAGIGFVCYAFNINLGSIVGAVALRFRLYARLGLAVDTITRILVLSWLTNWLGYIALAGLVFAISPITLPPDWHLDSSGLRYVGAALLVAATAYVGVCFGATRREWSLRGHAVRLPSGRVALLQLAASSLNWLLIAAVVWTVLQQRVDYPTVLGVLLLAAVAGVMAHIPAGLGVLEAVFVTLLAHRVGKVELIAALLTYRAIYYLVPLALAIPIALVIEANGNSVKRRGRIGIKA